MNFISLGYKQAMSHGRLLLVLFAVNAGFGLATILPLFFLLNDFAGQSMIAQQLSAGLDSLPFYGDLMVQQASGTMAVVAWMLVLMVFYVLFSLFLSGGVLSVFRKGEGYRPATFWGGAGSWWLPFVRLLLWSTLLLLLIAGVAAGFSFLVGLIWGDRPYEYVTFKANFVRNGLVLVGLFYWKMSFDYARTEMVLNNQRTARKAFSKANRFILKRFGSVTIIALGFVLPGLALTVGNVPLHQNLANPILVVALGQLYMLVRIFLKIGLAAGQWSFFHAQEPSNPRTFQPLERVVDEQPSIRRSEALPEASNPSPEAAEPTSGE